MAQYPNAIPSIAANKTNGTDTGDETQPSAVDDHAGHHNTLAAELVAALAEFGLNPSGSYSDVTTRLLNVLSVRDEGTVLGPVDAINFAGAGVAATVASRVATVTISGGGGGGGAELNAQEVFDLGTRQGSVSVNMAGHWNTLFTVQLSGAATFSIANWPGAGAWCELRIVQPNPQVAVTLPAAQWADRSPGQTTAAANAVDRFGFQYIGGFAVDGFVIGNDFG